MTPSSTTYYIDPVSGKDTHSGLKKKQAWRTFSPVNSLILAAGDRVDIVAPGSFDQTLRIRGSGTAKVPICINFAPGRYDFFPKRALARKYHISNTNADSNGRKAIGILFEKAKHIKMSGAGARIVFRSKMIQVCIDGSESIAISDMQFDYHRPTVSEFRVISVEEKHADIEVHRDSTYTIKNGEITWVGEGWSYKTGLAQELDLETNEIWRCGDPLQGKKLEAIKPFLLRATGVDGLKLGRVYQIRNTLRDCAGVFTRRSKDIVWRNVKFYYLHGMGLVNQFSENLTFDSVFIAPDNTSGRTCAAWADGIQFSGCRGKLVVRNCLFSGAHDDAINIHGTHLRVAQRISDKQIMVKFMHEQTYGFMAFNPGDEITFVRWDSLKTYGRNVVKAAELQNPREMLLSLEQPIPSDINRNDAVENITWTPEVSITGSTVERIPTRGFLVTTRRKVVIEDNHFHRTHMSAILLENDAKGWYESGPVRDMTIRDNRFYHCSEPVININPQNSVANNAVHQNIRIEGNHFALRSDRAVAGRSTKGLIVKGNTIYSNQKPNDSQIAETTDCTKVTIEQNHYLPLEEWDNKPNGYDGK